MANPQDDSGYEGWEIYPLNLGVSPLDADARNGHDRLSLLAGDLFVDKDGSQIEYLKLGEPNSDGSRDVELDTVNTIRALNSVFKQRYQSSIFFLSQSYTWSRLSICEEHFRKLFTRLRVHPNFLDIVHLFCEKIAPVEESFNAFFFKASQAVSPQSLSTPRGYSDFEIGYNIKYVTQHGRTFPKDPYSIREVGVYQKFDAATNRCNWVILQASESLKARLRSVFRRSNDSAPSNQFLIHAMILAEVSEDWRGYVAYLEEQFSKIVDRGFYSNVTGPKLEGDIETDFSDIRRLQILTDKLRRLVQILDLNIRLGKQMQASFMKIKPPSAEELHPMSVFGELEFKLDQFNFQQNTHMNRIKALIERAAGISQLVQNILEFRSTEQSKQTNSEMRTLTEQGVRENALMKTLTRQSVQDTRAMMTIALISAIFLPATFLATLFGSNFFWYSQEENKLTVASNFWLYIVTATIFSGLTVTLWWIWRRRRAVTQGRRDTDLESRFDAGK